MAFHSVLMPMMEHQKTIAVLRRITTVKHAAVHNRYEMIKDIR
jgi:hypothetical protein